MDDHNRLSTALTVFALIAGGKIDSNHSIVIQRYARLSFFTISNPLLFKNRYRIAPYGKRRTQSSDTAVEILASVTPSPFVQDDSKQPGRE